MVQLLSLYDRHGARALPSHCGAGTAYIAVAPVGGVYPCHQFVGLADWRMGSVLDNTLDASVQERFECCNVQTKPACAACWAKYYCSGGCAANAFLYNGDIGRPYEMSCKLLKKRTECAIGISIAEREPR